MQPTNETQDESDVGNSQFMTPIRGTSSVAHPSYHKYVQSTQKNLKKVFETDAKQPKKKPEGMKLRG